MLARLARNIAKVTALILATVPVVVIAGRIQILQKEPGLQLSPPLILQLNSSVEPYQIKRLSPEPAASRFASLGEEFSFDRGPVRFRVHHFDKIIVQDPILGQRDMSELTLKDIQTGKTVVLVRGFGVTVPSQ